MAADCGSAPPAADEAIVAELPPEVTGQNGTASSVGSAAKAEAATVTEDAGAKEGSTATVPAAAEEKAAAKQEAEPHVEPRRVAAAGEASVGKEVDLELTAPNSAEPNSTRSIEPTPEKGAQGTLAANVSEMTEAVGVASQEDTLSGERAQQGGTVCGETSANISETGAPGLRSDSSVDVHSEGAGAKTEEHAIQEYPTVPKVAPLETATVTSAQSVETDSHQCKMESSATDSKKTPEEPAENETDEAPTTHSEDKDNKAIEDVTDSVPRTHSKDNVEKATEVATDAALHEIKRTPTKESEADGAEGSSRREGTGSVDTSVDTGHDEHRASKRRREASPVKEGAIVVFDAKPAPCQGDPLEEFYHKRPAALADAGEATFRRCGSSSSSSQASGRDCGRGAFRARGGRGGYKPRVLKISGRNLDDDEMAQVLRKETGGEDTCPYSEVDLSRNALTSGGLGAVIRICRRCPELRVLKLFSNRIDDKGAEAIGDILGYCQGMEEVHLSHNRFTRKGIEAIVQAADRELPREAQRPLWLRLEHNLAESTEDLARALESRFRTVCGREDRERCTPRVCAKGRRIHLPFLIERPKGGGRGTEGGWEGGRERSRRGRLPCERQDRNRDRAGLRHSRCGGSGRSGGGVYSRHRGAEAHSEMAYADRDRLRHRCRCSGRSRDRTPPPRRRSGGRPERPEPARYASCRSRVSSRLAVGDRSPRPSPAGVRRRQEDRPARAHRSRGEGRHCPPDARRVAPDGRGEVVGRPPPRADACRRTQPPRSGGGGRGHGVCGGREDSREDSYSWTYSDSRDGSLEPPRRCQGQSQGSRGSVTSQAPPRPGCPDAVQERFRELQRFRTER